jgi:hypothetical protein
VFDEVAGGVEPSVTTNGLPTPGNRSASIAVVVQTNNAPPAFEKVVDILNSDKLSFVIRCAFAFSKDQ